MEGSVVGGIIGIIIFIVLQIIISRWFVEIAELKGYDSKSYHIFARCFWLGFVGWLYTIGLPDTHIESIGDALDKSDTTSDSQNSSGSWICRNCGEENPLGTLSCRKCGKS